MKEKQFCKLYNSYHGEDIDKVEQLYYISFSGVELKEFIEHCLIQLNVFTRKDMKITKGKKYIVAIAYKNIVEATVVSVIKGDTFNVRYDLVVFTYKYPNSEGDSRFYTLSVDEFKERICGVGVSK